jgi:hypothetical protein
MANLVKMWCILGIEIADRFSILSLHYIQDDFLYLVFFKTMTNAELNYPIYIKEMLVIVSSF